VFSTDAELTMQVNTQEIDFPSTVKGAKAISDVLVSKFGLRYENVYTFCVGEPPVTGPAFVCNWLVCMSEKDNGLGRVGFGRYEWVQEDAGLIRTLRITIEEMTTLPRDAIVPILLWAQKLPYPWCPRDHLADGRLGIDAVDRIRVALS
jgi:hypothetical protein